jgi:TetR/AcrR family transcriptional regulator, cholesterol catabolism regulator
MPAADERDRGAGTDGLARPAHPRWRERFDERRDEVIDAAARVFARRGYDATTVDDLVQATGLPRGSLYHYTSGKQDLLIQLHRRFIRPLLAQARAIEERELAPEATLRALAHALMRNIAEYRDEVTVFFHEWRVIEDDPSWHEIREERRQFEAIIDRALERGMREGVFAPQDRRIALLGFLGMINYAPQWFEPDGRMSAEAIAEQLSNTYLGGLVRPLAPGEPAADAVVEAPASPA